MASIEDPGPIQPVSGRKIEMRLEEHSFRKRFFATIVGAVSVANESYFDGMYLFKIESEISQNLSADHVLFHPESYEFHRGFFFRRGRIPKPGERYTASLEKFLISQNPALRGVRGRVYTSSHIFAPKEPMVFDSKYEFSNLAYGIVFRPSPTLARRG